MGRKAVSGIMLTLLVIGILTSTFSFTFAGEKPEITESARLIGSSVTQSVDSWPMFLHDLNHTGYSQVRGPKTNQTRWIYTTGGRVLSSPAIVDGIVFVGSGDHKLYALNETTGTLIWNYTTGGEIFSGPAVTDSIVYVGSHDHKVYALNKTTGAHIWNYTTGDMIYSSSPAVANGIVYIGSMDEKLYALNATTGAHIWNFTTAWFILSSPAVVGEIVYIGCRRLASGKLYALNATTGDLIWSYYVGDVYYSSPVISDDIVYIGTAGNNRLYALNASTGAHIWDYTAGDTILNSVAVAYGMVYVGSYDQNLYAFNKTTGSLVWKNNIGTHIVPAPAIADGVVYIGESPTYETKPAKMYAFNAVSGSLIWSYTTGEGQPFTYIQSSAAIADGTLVIGCRGDSKIYAFGELHGLAVTNITCNKAVVGRGHPFSVNVTVENRGLHDEVFNLTLYANATFIEKKEATVGFGASTTISFTVDTIGLAFDNYFLKAIVNPVSGETDTTDNTYVDGWVMVTIPGDVNGDYEVDVFDKVIVGAAFGATYNSTDGMYWHQPPDFVGPCIYCPHTPNADINDDLTVDVFDKVIVGYHFGETYP